MKFTNLFWLGLIITLSTHAWANKEALPTIEMDGLSDDSQINCIDKDVSDNLISSHGIQSHDFDNGKGLCDNTNPLKKLLASILTINSIKFNPSSPNGLDKGFVSNDYGLYFKNRIQKITYNSECEKNWIAYVHGIEPTMHVCGLFFDPKLSDFLSRISTLVHEARHTEGYSHVTCRSGYAKGSTNCDESYQEGGGYGVETEFYSRIALRSTNLHPVIKALARSAALARIFGGNFNSTPFELQAALALVDPTDGHLVLWKNNKVQESPKTKIGQGRMVQVLDRGMVLPNSSQELPKYLDLHGLDLIPLTEESQPIFKSDFKNILIQYAYEWTFEQRSQLLSYLTRSEGDGTKKVVLYKDRVEEVDVRQGIFPTEYSFTFKEGIQPFRIISVLPCLQNGKIIAGAFVQYETGEIDRIETGEDNFGNPKLTLSPAECKWPVGVIDVAKMDQSLFSLDSSGLVSQMSESGQLVPVSGLSSRKFSQMLGIKILPELME